MYKKYQRAHFTFKVMCFKRAQKATKYLGYNCQDISKDSNLVTLMEILLILTECTLPFSPRKTIPLSYIFVYYFRLSRRVHSALGVFQQLQESEGDQLDSVGWVHQCLSFHPRCIFFLKQLWQDVRKMLTELCNAEKKHSNWLKLVMWFATSNQSALF